MAGFPKFDPHAFVRVFAANAANPAKERRALATLAALADRHSKVALGPQHFQLAARWTGCEEERAAIIEYEANAPRPWAEALALLDGTSPPSSLDPRRWLLFINDCAVFLDQGWAPRATALGWTPFDLFGCDIAHEAIQFDRRSLLWQLEGARLVLLSQDTAIAQTDGKFRKYKRLPVGDQFPSIWQGVRDEEGAFNFFENNP